MKRLLVIIFFLSLAVIPCMAQTSAQKNRKAKLEREIAILDAQLKENRKRAIPLNLL